MSATTGTIRLSDLDEHTYPVVAWRELDWAGDCEGCGSSLPLAPADGRGAVYDGEDVACPECGLLGHTSVDEAGADIYWHDPDDSTARLRPSALAALRRLHGLRPHWP